MPKSASRSIVHTLSEVYGTKFSVTAGGQFPNAVLSRGVFQRLRYGRHISQEHIFPDFYNKLILEDQLERMVFHVRDPRQALISWVHHLQTEFEKQNVLPLRVLKMPEEYPEYSVQKKLNYVIEHHLLFFSGLLEAWRMALPSMEIPVLLSRYEDMTEAPVKFFQRIIDFYEIEPREPLVVRQPELGVRHFRSGKVDEWREVATPAQQKKMNAIIGADLLTHYGWPAD